MKRSMSRLLCVVFLFVAPIVFGQYKLDYERGKMVGIAIKLSIESKEKGWMLVHDAVRELEWRNVNNKSEFVRIEIIPFISIEEARDTFLRARDINTMVMGERYEGLGEEAWIFRPPYEKGGIIFRSGNIIFSVYASQLTDAIRMAKCAEEVSK